MKDTIMQVSRGKHFRRGNNMCKKLVWKIAQKNTVTLVAHARGEKTWVRSWKLWVLFSP